MRRGILPGLLLILLGAYLLIGQFFHLPDGLGLIFIGAALLAVRIARRRGYGYTIAGLMTMAVGLSSAIESSGLLALVRAEFLHGSLLLLLLAIAFFVLNILESRRIGNWPLIPGVCLLIVAGVVVAAQNPLYFERIWQLWPVALICAGAIVLAAAMRRRAPAVRGAPREEGPAPDRDGPAPPGGEAAAPPRQEDTHDQP